MTGWLAPQWVLLTALGTLTSINVIALFFQRRSWPRRLGWLMAQLSDRGILVFILIWGGFF